MFTNDFSLLGNIISSLWSQMNHYPMLLMDSLLKLTQTYDCLNASDVSLEDRGKSSRYITHFPSTKLPPFWQDELISRWYPKGNLDLARSLGISRIIIGFLMHSTWHVFGGNINLSREHFMEVVICLKLSMCKHECDYYVPLRTPLKLQFK